MQHPFLPGEVRLGSVVCIPQLPLFFYHILIGSCSLGQLVDSLPSIGHVSVVLETIGGLLEKDETNVVSLPCGHMAMHPEQWG